MELELELEKIEVSNGRKKAVIFKIPKESIPRRGEKCELCREKLITVTFCSGKSFCGKCFKISSRVEKDIFKKIPSGGDDDWVIEY